MSDDMDPRNVAGGWIDPESRQAFYLTRDVIINQLKRVSPEIAESFDRVCGDDLEAISELAAVSLTYATAGLSHAVAASDEVKETSGVLLQNVITSVTGGLSLLRQGFRLQAGMVARCAVEMLAVVLHLQVHPEDVNKIRGGEFRSSKAVTAASRLLPPFGQLYGALSDEFVHISNLHLSLQRLVEYTERDETLTAPLWAVQIVAWLAFVTSELVFHDLVPRPRYWRRLDTGGYAWAPSPEERAWMTDFFGMEPES